MPTRLKRHKNNAALANKEQRTGFLWGRTAVHVKFPCAFTLPRMKVRVSHHSAINHVAVNCWPPLLTVHAAIAPLKPMVLNSWVCSWWNISVCQCSWRAAVACDCRTSVKRSTHSRGRSRANSRARVGNRQDKSTYQMWIMVMCLASGHTTDANCPLEFLVVSFWH